MSNLATEECDLRYSMLAGLKEHLRIRGYSTSNLSFEHSLIAAAHVSTVGFCRQLIDAGASPLVIDERGNSPLTRAAHSGLTDICKLLLEVGVPVDHALPGNKTPLVAACESAKIEVVKTLIEAGANVNYQCKAGWRVIHYAARGGSVEIGKLLISAGANLHDKVHSVSVGEVSLVQVARACEKYEFVAWLESDVLNASTSPIQVRGRKVRL